MVLLVQQALQGLVDLDTDLFFQINQLHNAFFDHFMSTYSGKWIWVPLYASILYMVFRNFSLKTSILCVVAVALTITFADQVCSSAIRPFVERMRPSNLQNPISEFVHIVDGHRGGRYGFPSCHAANTFGLAFFLLFLFRKWRLSAFMMGWALLTCYSRVYLGVHYPGDLLAGMLVGLAGAALMYSLFAWVSKYKRPAEVKASGIPVVVGLLTIAGIVATIYI